MASYDPDRGLRPTPGGAGFDSTYLWLLVAGIVALGIVFWAMMATTPIPPAVDPAAPVVPLERREAAPPITNDGPIDANRPRVDVNIDVDRTPINEPVRD